MADFANELTYDKSARCRSAGKGGKRRQTGMAVTVTDGVIALRPVGKKGRVRKGCVIRVPVAEAAKLAELLGQADGTRFGDHGVGP